MKTIKANLIGCMPLMMHNGRLADPLDPHTQELGKLTKVRKKTESQHEQVRRAEFMGSLYMHGGKVVVPSTAILACTVEGARKSKLGKQATAGVLEAKEFFELQYDGPRTPDKLYEDGRFVDTRAVVVSRAKVMRTRPIFREWSLPIELLVDESIIEPDFVVDALVKAGQVVGLLEYRPRFGRFEVADVEVGSMEVAA